MFLKKIIFFSMIVVYAFDAMAMQIITPYEPGFAAKYPKIAGAGKMLLLASGIYAVGRVIEEYAPEYLESDSFKIGISALAWGGAYSIYSSRPALIDSLLTDPRKSLEDIYAVNDACEKDAKSQKIDEEKNITHLVNKLEILFQTYEQKCPLFLLGECTQSDWLCQCEFTRSTNPHYRKIFEERVSQTLLAKIVARNNQQPVNYTSFGCGGALTEMVILAKLLAKKPDAKLNIHLIEGNTIPYVAAADYLDVSRQIVPGQQPLDFGDRLNDYIAFVKEQDKIDKTSDDDIAIQFIGNGYMVQKKYMQIITFLHSTFPQAQLSLSIHNLTKNYLGYIEKHNLPHADVMTAADIQDEMSLLRNGPANYVDLCTQTLKANPSSSNMWLMKNQDNDAIKIGIGSFSLDQKGTAEPLKFEDETAYLTFEKL